MVFALLVGIRFGWPESPEWGLSAKRCQSAACARDCRLAADQCKN
jgi:hypothetical protein